MKLTHMGPLPGMAASAQAGTAPSLKVEFGKPSHIHHLTYLVLYKDKPFKEATLYYYDNGLYKIVSPGEEHYGVYVVRGSFTDTRYAISYISLPSSDWYGNVALHDLSFDQANGAFQQQAHRPSDQKIPPQHGHFRLEANTIADPRPIRWQQPPQR